MLLQLHIICNGRFPTILQLFSITMSSFSLGKVAVELHIGVHQFVAFKLCEKNIKVVKLLPLFITCLIFRMGTLLILCTYLNWWAIIPVFSSFVMVMLFASQHGQQPVESLLAGLANVFIISPGIKLADLAELHYKEEVLKVSQLRKFYKKSSYFLFLFYAGILSLFLCIYYFERKGSIQSEWFNMPYWGKKAFNESSFSQFGGLYTFSAFVILTGLVNILIIHVDKGEELLDIDTPTPRSSATISEKSRPISEFINDEVELEVQKDEVDDESVVEINELQSDSSECVEDNLPGEIKDDVKEETKIGKQHD